MFGLFQTLDPAYLDEHRESLRWRRHGVIEVRDQRLVGIQLRPWPKMISVVEARWWGERQHQSCAGGANRCQLHYSQPRSAAGMLALKYIVSTSGTTFATFRGALVILDEIARLKNAPAIVCDVTNNRISHRLLTRMGWQRHLESSTRRHYIKRFYEGYPDHEGQAILRDAPINRPPWVPRPQADSQPLLPQQQV